MQIHSGSGPERAWWRGLSAGVTGDSLKPQPAEGGCEDAQITGNAIQREGTEVSSGGSHLHGLDGHTPREKSGGPGRWSVMVARQAWKGLQCQHTDVSLRLMTRVTREG